MILGICLAAVAVLVDQLTKFLIYGNAPVSILGDFLWFQSTLNTGASFGILENSRVLLTIIAIFASIFFLCVLFSKKYFSARLEKICIGLILGGTVSNLIDRIIFGGVRDYIYFKFINFAIFNVADMCICLPVIILAIFEIIMAIKKDKKPLETEEQESQTQEESEKKDQSDDESENNNENITINKKEGKATKDGID